MAIVPVLDAIEDTPALSAENNKIIDNVIDLDARLGPVVSTSTAHARLTALEARTTDTATAPGGIGNQQLANRFGTGVGTSTSDVVAGTATAQLTSLRSRVTVIETGDACYAYQTAAQSIPNTTSTFVIFGAVAFDTNSMWNVGGFTTRITIKKDGIYLVSAVLSYVGAPAIAVSNERRLAQVFRNGSVVQGMSGAGPLMPSAANTIPVATPAAPLGLFVNDYLQLSAYQDSGGAKNTVVTAGYNPFLSVTYLRPLP